MSKKSEDLPISNTDTLVNTDISSQQTENAASQTNSELDRELAYYEAKLRSFLNGEPAHDWFEAEQCLV
jgi:hypothetical protein